MKLKRTIQSILNFGFTTAFYNADQNSLFLYITCVDLLIPRFECTYWKGNARTKRLPLEQYSYSMIICSFSKQAPRKGTICGCSIFKTCLACFRTVLVRRSCVFLLYRTVIGWPFQKAVAPTLSRPIDSPICAG